MRRVLVLYAHPGQRHSQINVELARMAQSLTGITLIDLYAEYPRFKIDIDVEQARLVAHDVIVFQFPIYWYSTPALLKEWQDLVLEQGFAYGPGGDKLAGKLFVPVVTAGAAEDGYCVEGCNHFRLRTLLSPLEQTANLCLMRFIPPLVLFAALKARDDGRAAEYIVAYQRLLEALRDDDLDLGQAATQELLSAAALPLRSGV